MFTTAIVAISALSIVISCLSIGYRWGARDERIASLYRPSQDGGER